MTFELFSHMTFVIASQLAEEISFLFFFLISISGFTTTCCFQIQKKRTGQGAGSGCAGEGVLRWGGQVGGQPSPEAGSHTRGQGVLLPLLGWTFQKITGGGWVHSGEPLMPGHWAGRRGGRDERHLESIWATLPPYLGQELEVTRKGLLPGSWCHQQGEQEC